MKKNHFIMSALLFCGLSVFTACSDVKDNPVPEPPVPTVNERAVFEEQFSKDLQAMADGFRFEAAMKTTFSLNEFIMQLDAESLSKNISQIVSSLINGLQAKTLDDYSDQDKTNIANLLKTRFNMTDQDIQAMNGIFVVDAYNSIGKMKLNFKDGSCEFGQADAFTIVSTNMSNETKTIALKFNDERDGLLFFVTRIGSNPIAIQLPKSIGVTMTTAQGEIVNGTLELTTAAEGQSKFVSFKESAWVANAKLTANVNSRQESVSLYAKHTEQRAFDLKAAFEIQGKEMVRFECNDMHDAYSEEEINSEEFKSLREMGPFFSAAYDVLKALQGKSIDNVQITVNDNMVIAGKVDNIAKSLIALGNVRKLHGTKPGKEVVDQYTQQLNGLVHFTVSQKNTGINANGTLVTAQKDMQDGEYQPAVALQFEGETEAQVVLDRMTDTDKANYKTMMANFSQLTKEISQVLIAAREKGKAILDAVKGSLSM